MFKFKQTSKWNHKMIANEANHEIGAGGYKRMLFRVSDTRIIELADVVSASVHQSRYGSHWEVRIDLRVPVGPEREPVIVLDFQNEHDAKYLLRRLFEATEKFV